MTVLFEFWVGVVGAGEGAVEVFELGEISFFFGYLQGFFYLVVPGNDDRVVRAHASPDFIRGLRLAGEAGLPGVEPGAEGFLLEKRLIGLGRFREAAEGVGEVSFVFPHPFQQRCYQVQIFFFFFEKAELRPHQVQPVALE